jgi:hypothetical protein
MQISGALQMRPARFRKERGNWQSIRGILIPVLVAGIGHCLTRLKAGNIVVHANERDTGIELLIEYRASENP